MTDYSDWSDEDMWADILREATETLSDGLSITILFDTKSDAVKAANYLRSKKLVCHVEVNDEVGFQVAVYYEENIKR
jgi:hypothetical protein